MALSFIPARGQLVELPVRRSFKPNELDRELSELRSELRCVNEAIRALERLAGLRFPKHRSGRQAGSRA
jgi:hypothetical protein